MTQLQHWLAALYLPKIGPRLFHKWLSAFHNIEAFFQSSKSDLRLAGVPEDYIALIKQPNWQQVENDLKWETVPNQNIIHFEHEAYPILLKEIADPPLVLFAKGNSHALNQKQIGIVGARNASTYGLRNAEQFSATLAKSGLVITSGLARGVDGAAHQGALFAKGITIAVTGTGLRYTYPKSHIRLAEKILENNGLLLSEFPLNMPPVANNFPRRNRIISGMSLGVVVIEASLKSGTLITAKHAMEQNREVFAIPGSINSLLSKGCHALIKDGAKLIETASDVLEEFGLYLNEIVEDKQKPLPPLENDSKRILDQIDHEITVLDVIISRTGLTASQVSSILLSLELLGYIQSVPGGYVKTA